MICFGTSNAVRATRPLFLAGQIVFANFPIGDDPPREHSIRYDVRRGIFTQASLCRASSARPVLNSLVVEPTDVRNQRDPG